MGPRRRVEGGGCTDWKSYRVDTWYRTVRTSVTDPNRDLGPLYWKSSRAQDWLDALDPSSEGRTRMDALRDVSPRETAQWWHLAFS